LDSIIVLGNHTYIWGVMGSKPTNIQTPKPPKMVCAHALQGLVHQTNGHITESKVHGAQHYTNTYKAHIIFRLLWGLGRYRGAITTKITI
jgi:hypothetical protein